MIETNNGRFVWFELMTSDPKAAIPFYTEVIGWKSQPYADDAASGYTMWLGSQGPLGGVMELPEPARKMGAPPHWTSNVEVTDVDATVAKVRELGGNVFMGPTDLPKIGRFAVIADPQGAAINIFKPATDMSSHDNSKQGEFIWCELLTTDHEAGFRFYNTIFGWEKITEHDMGPMGKYLIYGRKGKPLGGMMTKSKEMPMPSSWIYYVQVADLEGAVARATKMGARLLHGPMDVPGGSRIAQLADPQGAVFALHSGVVGMPAS